MEHAAAEGLPTISGSSSYPESSVKLHHNVGKVNPFSAADKLSDLRMVVSSDVVTHKVPVDAVPAPLLLVKQDVRSWKEKVISSEVNMALPAPTDQLQSHLPPSS